MQKGSRKSVWSFALFGAVTGVLSYVAHNYHLLAVPFFEPYVTCSRDCYPIFEFSVIPGFVFGALIAYLNWKFSALAKFQLAVVVCATAFSWLVAVNAAEMTFFRLDKIIPPALQFAERDKAQAFGFAISGMIGGLVGGTGTLLGVALANGRARKARGFLPIVVAATLIGSMLGIPPIQVWQVQLSMLLLFCCWQAAFAGMLAQVLARSGSELSQ